MIEQAAAPVPTMSFHAAGLVVSITLSAGALVTALGTLWKVGHWMGRRESTEEHVEKRLDSIANDVRDVRAFLMTMTQAQGGK